MALVIPLDEATKIVAEAMTEAYERGRDVGEAERKVIEAAKAWQKGERAVVCDIGQDEYERFYPTELVDLLVALEALLAVEVEFQL